MGENLAIMLGAKKIQNRKLSDATLSHNVFAVIAIQVASGRSEVIHVAIDGDFSELASWNCMRFNDLAIAITPFSSDARLALIKLFNGFRGRPEFGRMNCELFDHSESTCSELRTTHNISKLISLFPYPSPSSLASSPFTARAQPLSFRSRVAWLIMGLKRCSSRQLSANFEGSG